MAQLLVSVRSVGEAEAALAGGAAVIDVKEPARGSLGRSDVNVVRAIVRAVGGRRLVSAALGEWCECSDPIQCESLAFVKWGLAGCGARARWREELLAAQVELSAVALHCRLVAVAYADWQRSAAPPPQEVCKFACEHHCGAFLLDTWHKDGSTLLDWQTVESIVLLTQQCRAAGIRTALAGSLGISQIARLAAAEPDWFAVRGAVCQGADRGSCIRREAVQEFVEFLSRR